MLPASFQNLFWQKKHALKEDFDETADSGKNCSTQEMSATSILGLIQAI